MVKLDELYLLGNKVVVICDIVYSNTEEGNLIFYKEEGHPNRTLNCQLEEAFLNLAVRYVNDIAPHDKD